MKDRKVLKELNFYYMLAFMFSGALYGLAMLVCKALGIREIETILLTTMAAQLAPALSVIVTRHRDKSALLPAVGVKLAPLSLLLCTMVPFVSVLSQHLLQTALGKTVVLSAFFQSVPLSLVAVSTTLVGSIGEEIGWRGYLYGTLRTRMKLWQASALTGLMWGVWHFTKIFTHGLPAYLLFVLSLIPLSMVMTYANDKAQSPLASCLLCWRR